MLQYRGVCWTQKNGKDWTVKAFLMAEDGGLGLDVARDAATQRSVLGALTELATTSLERLRGKRLEAEDFDRLFFDDPTKDILLWLSDSKTVQSSWTNERWSAFTSRCKAELKLDPDGDGKIVGAALLGRCEGPWRPVWERFAESPALYPGIPERLRQAMPSELFVEPSSWPQQNEKEEAALRQALLALEKTSPSAARDQILRLEERHGMRREWVWAKLNQASLARSLAPLAALAARTSSALGGASVADMAKLYVDGAWQVDAAALSSMAAVKSSADTQAVSRALNAIYRSWLEDAARHLQALREGESLTVHDKQETYEEHIAPGTVLLFADGLRFDVSQRLVKKLKRTGRSVSVTIRWAGLPMVTATAKPAASSVTESIKGVSLGEGFRPVIADTDLPLTTGRFRKLLAAVGYQYIGGDETGEPTGRAWTENGELDKLGHSLQGKLAARIDDPIELLFERIEILLKAGCVQSASSPTTAGCGFPADCQRSIFPSTSPRAAGRVARPSGTERRLRYRRFPGIGMSMNVSLLVPASHASAPATNTPMED